MPRNSRKNIKMMILLIIMFIIGIFVRREFIGKGLLEVKTQYVELLQNMGLSDADTTKVSE